MSKSESKNKPSVKCEDLVFDGTNSSSNCPLLCSYAQTAISLIIGEVNINLLNIVISISRFRNRKEMI